MNVRLATLRRSLPRSVKLGMLDRLARVTAEGFGTHAPEWTRRDFESRLTEYAFFTALHAGLCVGSGDGLLIQTTRERLRSSAARLGLELRGALNIRGEDEAFRALRGLYRQIGIDLDYGPRESVVVRHCFFAEYYSPAVCQVVEALDQGLVEGLFGGASLEFAERITEGRPCCRAALRLRPRDGWSEP